MVEAKFKRHEIGNGTVCFERDVVAEAIDQAAEDWAAMSPEQRAAMPLGYSSVIGTVHEGGAADGIVRLEVFTRQVTEERAAAKARSKGWIRHRRCAKLKNHG